MKIRQENVDRLEPVSRRDEDIRLGRERLHRSVGGAGAFQGAQGSRADSNDTAASGPCGIEARGGVFKHRTVLRMHHMLIRIRCADGQECPCANMQGKVHPADAACGQAIQQAVREMKPGRWCGEGTFLPRIDGLVVGKIAPIRRPQLGDIGRQRHRPDCRYGPVQLRAGPVECQYHFAPLPGADTGLKAMAEG